MNSVTYIEDKELGATEVVAEDAVRTKTAAGWRVVAIVQEALARTVWQYQNGINAEVPAGTSTLTKYLVAEGRDATLRRVAEEAEAHRVHALECENARKQAERDLAAEKEGHAMVQRALDRATKTEADLRAKLAAEADRNRRLETDLAKVRTAVGDLKMRDILAEKQP